jgi:hypothetical protein
MTPFADSDLHHDLAGDLSLHLKQELHVHHSGNGSNSSGSGHGGNNNASHHSNAASSSHHSQSINSRPT